MSASRFAQDQTKHALLAIRTADKVIDALNLFRLDAHRKEIEEGYTYALLRILQDSRDRGLVDLARRREAIGLDAPLVSDVVPTAGYIYDRYVAGIVPQVKQLTAETGSAVMARESVRSRMHGTAHVLSQSPARQVIQDSAEAARVAGKVRGWRRAAGVGRAPCGWCAVLIARGVIRDRELQAGGGRKYHRWCSCQPVEVVDLWTPSETEQHFIDSRNAVMHDHPGASAPQVAALMNQRMGGERAKPKKSARPNPGMMPGRTTTQKIQQPKRKTERVGAASGGGFPPDRPRGGGSGGWDDGPDHMWDGEGPDEFATINGVKPPFKRSDIERPRPEVISTIAYQHSSAAGNNKTPFPDPWEETDVANWIADIVKFPTEYVNANTESFDVSQRTDGYALRGTSRDIYGHVVVRSDTVGWYIPTAHPLTR